MSAATVSVQGLSKRYRRRGRAAPGVTAVAGLDLSVGDGLRYVLLGPNGAGKTTTLEILAGYRRRDAGHVRVLGEDPQHGSLAWRSQLGIVLQHYRDLPELTVAEAVRHFAGYYPDPADPAEVIDRVGLSGHAGRRLRTLSGGQRRRLDLALGIIGRPRLLLLDEPTVGLDPRARAQFGELIGELARQAGTTVLLSTHDLDEAEAVADRIGVIVAGRLVAEGTPDTLGGRDGLATVSWRERSRQLTVRVADPATLVTQLTAQLGGALTDLRVSRPTLAEVYLRLSTEQRP